MVLFVTSQVTCEHCSPGICWQLRAPLGPNNLGLVNFEGLEAASVAQDLPHPNVESDSCVGTTGTISGGCPDTTDKDQTTTEDEAQLVRSWSMKPTPESKKRWQKMLLPPHFTEESGLGEAEGLGQGHEHPHHHCAGGG